MLNAIRAAPVCGRVPLFVPLCVVFNGMGELGVCGVLSCVSPVGAWFRRTVPQRTEALSGGGRVGGSRVPRSCTREGLTRRVVASTRCTACRRSRMRASGSTPRMPSTASSKSRSRCSRKLLAFREGGGDGARCPGYGGQTTWGIQSLICARSQRAAATRSTSMTRMAIYACELDGEFSEYQYK